MIRQITKSDLENLLKRLFIQRRRFLRAITRLKNDYKRNNSYIHHDLDYYLVISRRLYRFVQELAKKDSRIANIKGKKEYSGLYKKIKMRDHSEHPPVDFSEFPSIVPGSSIKVIHSVVINNDGIFVKSGSKTWNMDKDNSSLVSLIKEVARALVSQ